MRDKVAVVGIVLAVLGTIAVMFLWPVISFGIGYFTGWVLQITIGGTVAAGLNMILGEGRFTPETIPLFCATMGLIGGFFRSNLTLNKKKDD